MQLIAAGCRERAHTVASMNSATQQIVLGGWIIRLEVLEFEVSF